MTPESMGPMGRPGAAAFGWRLMAVFVLGLAVVLMHSLGAGHHGTATTAHGTHAANGTPGAAAEPQHTPVAGMATSHVSATCLDCLSPGEHALGAMCLAVVSSLVSMTILLALWHLLRRSIPLSLPAWSRVVLVWRPPLRRMALSPIEVCVLRT